MSTIYICGPMAGYPDLNRTAFDEAAALIEARGDRAVVPHDVGVREHDGPCPSVYDGQPAAQGDHDGGCYLRADLAQMVDADAVHVLPGWSRSRGAQIEVLLARLLHIPIKHAPDAERGGSPIADLAGIVDEIRRQDAKWGDQSRHPDGTGPETYPLRMRGSANLDGTGPETYPLRMRGSANLDLRTATEVADLLRSDCEDAFRRWRGTWRHIFLEEVGEALAEDGPALDVELHQVAAVAVQWVAARARRKTQP